MYHYGTIWITWLHCDRQFRVLWTSVNPFHLSQKPWAQRPCSRSWWDAHLVRGILHWGRNMLSYYIHQASWGAKKLVQYNLQQWPNIHLIYDRFEWNSKSGQSVFQCISVFTQDMTVDLVEGIKNEVDEGTLLFGIRLFARETSRFLVEINISPKTSSKSFNIKFTWNEVNPE